MKKTIIIASIAVVAFLAGWTFMVPTLDCLAKHRLSIRIKGSGTVKNGPWMARLDLARSDTPPFVRAYIVRIGIAANQAEETLYWNAYADSGGRLLDGNHAYDVGFTARPPVRETGFWSLTVYGEDNYLVPNKEKRYAVGDRSPLQKLPDGSFVIHISRRQPHNISNWLPCPPNGVFTLTLRMYVPREETLKRPEAIAMPEIACLDCR
jgi:hypothetical protein